MNIPFLSFDKTNKEIRREILESFEMFFDSNQYILGARVSEFEQSYAAFNRVEYVLGVSNGLDALFLALKALGIEKGDEVIVPSNTFIATVLAITYLDAVPVFAEPDIVTYNINPNNIEELITNRTRAIIPVHLYGQACEMGKIIDIANRYDLFIVEDNAQAQGAKWKKQLTGSFGIINATSFYPGKNLGALGDAGAITTNNGGLYERLRAFRNYGSLEKYNNKYVGYNKRMDECHAAFLKVKLTYLDRWNKQREAIANIYNNELLDIKGVITPEIHENATSVYHLYVIRIAERNQLQTFLKKHGIGTLIHYPIPPHLQECYKHLNYSKGDFPIAEELSETSLSLPIYPGLEHDAVIYICNCIRKYMESKN